MDNGYDLIGFLNITDATTLFYFFSTLAQSYAAITAFFFAIAQMRFSKLEDKIAATRKSILYIHLGHDVSIAGLIEYNLCMRSNEEIIAMATEPDTPKKKLADDLASYVAMLNNLKTRIKGFTTVGIGLTATGVVSVILVKQFTISPTIGGIVVFIAICGVVASVKVLWDFIKLVFD